MPLDLLIHNVTAVTPGGLMHGAVAIDDGRIAEVLAGGSLPVAERVIDGDGNYLLPGVVDIHVHFREPGQEYKATYRSESSAAAVGGVTTVCDMPNNGQLAVVSAERVAGKVAVATRDSYVDFGVYAYLVAGTVDGLRALLDAGAIGFKWDMSLAGVEVAPGMHLPTPETALPAFQAAAALGVTIGIHAEDRPLVLRLTEDLRAAGRRDAAAHVEARPVQAEVTSLEQAIDLVRRSGVHLHVHHLSSAAGLELVRAAKRDGLPVTAETIPPFLFLDATDYERLGTVMKIHPAVKYPADRAALWAGLHDGTIDCVATDHAPHTVEEKQRSVWEASPGAIGVQTLLPLMLTEVAHGRLSLERCVELLSANPARCHGLNPRKGVIVPGADADLVLVDLDRRQTLRGADMLTPNHLTPFEGVQVQGVPLLTLLRGAVIAQDGGVVGMPRGMSVRPGRGST